jgi:hypothetical protein
MTDPSEICFEIPFHFNSDPVFEQIFFSCQKFGRQGTDALLCKFAIGCTPEIHFRIDESVAAVMAFPGGIIFEEFNGMAALGTGFLKNRPGFPIATVLTRTFHNS